MEWHEVRERIAAGEGDRTELKLWPGVPGSIRSEDEIVPGSSPDDVATGVFESFLSRLGIDPEEEPTIARVDDLRNRGIVGMDDGEPRLTLYGVLCFSRNPQGYAPTRSAWTQTTAYAGVDRASEVILSGEARGRVDEQVEYVLGWIKALGIREEYGPIFRTDHYVVPLRALREAVVNAVVHRDYAVLGSKVLVEVFTDRVDVTSPGPLPNHMSVESALAGGHPRSRNELIAHYMTVRGLMEVRGRGLLIIAREMREFNDTRPELVSNIDGGFVRLTLRR